MATIRPYAPLNAPQPAAKPARSAAQQAFFAAALSGTAAPAAPAAAEPARAVAPSTVRVRDVPVEEPARPLRSGSLLDIKV